MQTNLKFIICFILLVSGCCVEKKEKSFEPTRDEVAELEIIRKMKNEARQLNVPKAYEKVNSVESVLAKTEEDGTLSAKIYTYLDYKKSNKPTATGLCTWVLSYTYNGKSLDYVEVFAANKEMLVRTHTSINGYLHCY